MAIRLDYLARETGNNLIRTPSLTIATVLTVAVSLALLGAALVLMRGVDGLNARFKGDVEFIIWIDKEATEQNVQGVRAALDASPNVRDSIYVNREETFQEFQEFWAESPEVLAAVTPDQLPTSFRVTPSVADLSLVEALGNEFETLPGVQEVDYAGEYIKKLDSFTRTASTVMIVTAIISALSSALLMYNTIRTALYARRREVEVMRLVGAANWFIRIPFMLEGMIQGLLGAGLSTLAVYGLNRVITQTIETSDFQLFDPFALEPSQLTPIALWLLAVGAGIGFLSSGIAVTRYLDT